MTRISALPNRPGPTQSSVFFAAALWLEHGVAVGGGGHNASVILHHRFEKRIIRRQMFPSNSSRVGLGRTAIGRLRGCFPARHCESAEDRQAPARKSRRPDGRRRLSIGLHEAWLPPEETRLSSTVFVATDPVDGGFKRYMSWEQICELKEEGVTIGNQTAGHLHMAASGETRNRSDLEKSNNRFEKELGETPNLIAYPYGETSMAVVNLVKDMGFIAGFGQHSGAIGPSEPLYYLPRFSMNENFGDLKRFKTAAGALSLPHRDFTPEDPTIAKDRNPPLIGFTLEKSVANGSINCYASH